MDILSEAEDILKGKGVPPSPGTLLEQYLRGYATELLQKSEAEVMGAPADGALRARPKYRRGDNVVVIGAEEVMELVGYLTDGRTLAPGEKPSPENFVSHVGHKGKVTRDLGREIGDFLDRAEIVCECGESFSISVQYLRHLSKASQSLKGNRK